MVVSISRHNAFYIIYRQTSILCYKIYNSHPWPFTVCLLKVKVSLLDTILQHLQLHRAVHLELCPKAMFLTFTTLFLILEPVFFTNWEIFGLTLGLVEVWAIWVDIIEIYRLGLSDLNVLLLMLETERWLFVGVLALGREEPLSGILDSAQRNSLSSSKPVQTSLLIRQYLNRCQTWTQLGLMGLHSLCP